MAALDEAWLSARVAAEAGLEEVRGADGTVAWLVVKAPEGDLAWTERFAAGRLVEVVPGPAGTADAEVTLTAPYEEARAIARGELDPAVPFMQGRLKFAGDMGTLLALLPVWARPDRVAARAALGDGG